MENILWTIGTYFKPQMSYLRKDITIVISLITIIDDVYDVYGTLDELERFTNAVERWDLREMEHLPDYMKMCFLALFNSINEMGYDTLKKQGVHIIPFLQNMILLGGLKSFIINCGGAEMFWLRGSTWADLCKSHLEAKWYNSRYTPSFEEYMNNARISISASVVSAHAYVLCTSLISYEGLKCVEKYPNLIRCLATISRLADDLGTSTDEMKRGDIPKSIQCYMHETGVSEEDARKHMKYLIGEEWKKMNEARVEDGPHFSRAFIGVAENLTRMAQCMYQYGDGYAAQAHLDEPKAHLDESKSSSQAQVRLEFIWSVHVKEGHIKRDCPKYKAHDQSSDTAATTVMDVDVDEDEIDVLLTASEDGKSDWVLDSGSAYHLCRDKEVFFAYAPCEGRIWMANNTSSRVVGRGSVQFYMADEKSVTLTEGELLSDMGPVVLARRIDKGSNRCIELWAQERRDEAMTTHKVTNFAVHPGGECGAPKWGGAGHLGEKVQALQYGGAYTSLGSGVVF
ncbi:terpenoid cyclases/Protein prenyltransferases superfamily protein [Actinidia rufa]|uniref:Terpenoid cyclases/Protein prenyltransferases superfamily protein n=1 Tax=Actinidia rufa TaxID=165716 RepID=A0A7J0DL65_9ERIC|nr:terpenoid cyclases/Protein prenyltransferases superfamily protein [Actinidia rufa]